MAFLHEVFFSSGERPFLLTLSAALIGFPLVLRGIESIERQPAPRKEKEEDKSLSDW
jgi:hypothetical protein